MSMRLRCVAWAIPLLLCLGACTAPAPAPESESGAEAVIKLRVASFNVSMEATNYVGRDRDKAKTAVLQERLQHGDDPQIRNIAEIIQRVRPDVLLLNEFDYIEDPQQGILAFQQRYLSQGQGGAEAIDYPYFYINSVNTGVNSGLDVSGDGKAGELPGDGYGFGFFPGHYGMAVLSKYPLDENGIRTFQYFLWKDMPQAVQPADPESGEPWYDASTWEQLRLSSKSHWDIPIFVEGRRFHLLASHPTPPVFDGPEDRNGARNHDEIRFWLDYVSGAGDYIYDDKGAYGGLQGGQRFVIVGDQNASAVEGDARRESIAALLDSPLTATTLVPESEGGRANKPESEHAASHTAYWGMRADYVIPSTAGFRVSGGGVFWPRPDDELHRLIASRSASSDHRLVWLDLELTAL